MTAPLRVERSGPDGILVRVVLERPDHHNAFDAELIDALRRTFGRLAEEPAERLRAVVLAGEGSVLKSYDPRKGGGWETVADLAPLGLTGITRLSVSPRGDAVAIVAVPAAPARDQSR